MTTTGAVTGGMVAVDGPHRTGGWMRLGNRVNEGYAELSVCLYLPDGRIACQFQRPNITANDRFDGGGTVDMYVCDNAPTLVHLANQAGLTLHPWLSTVRSVHTPDRLIFDLVPPARLPTPS